MSDIISNEEMANYMNMVLNSNVMKEAYLTSEKPEHANGIFQNVGNILAKYYISTGDNSIESASELISGYISTNGNESFLKNILLPKIEKKVAENLNLGEELSLQDRIKIQEYVDARNNNNLFYTHCFPGALYEEVKANGLDISRELFKEEYEILSNCQAFRTAFKVGQLNYCELSSASLSYATKGIPERATFSVGGNPNQQKGESLHDAYIRSFNEKLNEQLENGNITESQFEEMKNAGIKIIDFYCVSKSGIAFFRKDYRTIENNKIRKIILNRFSDFGKDMQGTFLYSLFQEQIAEVSKNPEQAEEIYQKAFEKIITIFPDLKDAIDAHIENALEHGMKNYAIKNYTHGGFADGYSLEGGKLAPQDMGIVEITTPSEVVVAHQREEREGSNFSVPQSQSVEPTLRDEKIYKTLYKEIAFYDRNFKEIIKQKIIPQAIEDAKVSWNNKFHRRVILATKDGEIMPIGYPMIGEEDGRKIYSSFPGNVDRAIITAIEDDVAEFPKEAKDVIIEQYKKAVPDYDEDFLYDYAINWYAVNQFEKLDEATKDEKRKEYLEGEPKFIVYQKDGEKVVAPLIDGKPIGESKPELIYSRTLECKYNKLFNEMLNESMPLANYHISIFETETCQRVMQNIAEKSTLESETLKRQLECANEMYKKSLKLMGFVGDKKTGGFQKVGKNLELTKMMKKNPRAFAILKHIAEEEEKNNPERKLSYLSASVKICEMASRDAVNFEIE